MMNTSNTAMTPDQSTGSNSKTSKNLCIISVLSYVLNVKATSRCATLNSTKFNQWNRLNDTAASSLKLGIKSTPHPPITS